MGVAIYIRVSTDEQAQHGFSLEAQKDRLIAYCVSQGWDEYEIYNDDGYSGTTLERPGIQRLIRAAEKKKFDTVIVYRLDRLSRRQRDVLHLLEEVFEKNDIAFKSATEPFDTSTPLGKAMLGILAVFAQLERETIIERTMEGHKRRARNGLWGGGPQPFGYQWNKEEQKLEIVEKEARIVRGIFQRVIGGESLTKIQRWARSLHPNKWWDHNVIRHIVTRPTYLGYITYGDHLGEGNHEAIVDEETYQRANDEIKRRNYGTRAIGKYLLSGLLRCGECGEPVSSAPKRGFLYYVCARKNAGKSYYKGGLCTSRHIRGNELEEAIVDELRSVASNAEDIKGLLDASSATVSKEDIEQLSKDIAQIERRIKRWDEAYEAEEISRQKWRDKVQPLEQEKMNIEKMIDELEGELNDKPQGTHVIDMFKMIDKAWDALEFGEKQAVLRTVIDKIVVYKDARFEIQYNV